MTREQAAEIVKRIRYYMEGGECWAETEFEAMDMAVDALENGDRRRGRWILEWEPYEVMTAHCSCCGAQGSIGDPYCRCCGVKMDVFRWGFKE